MGSHVATPRSSLKAGAEEKLKRTEIEEIEVKRVEAWIDEMDDQLPALKNFILPSGGIVASHVHVARTVCRRAERSMSALMQDGHIDKVPYTYINRMSDYLFTLGRYCAMKSNEPETIYQKSKSGSNN